MEDMVKELTKLRPQMLQQFAAAHQNDTMALLAAKAASEEQKKIMAARQPQQMGTPPKVNEQVVASIAQPPQAPQQQMQSMQAPQAAPQAQGLPEESGIAQLPAPNMQGLAGGGIVAFSTGGINDPMFRQFLSSLGKGSEFANGDPSTRKALLDAFAKATSGPRMPVAGTVAPAPTVPSAPGVNYNAVQSPYQRLMSGPKAGLGSLAVPGAVALGGAVLSNAAANNLSNRSNEELDMLSNAGGGDDTALAAAILREDRNTREDRAPVSYRGSKAYPYTGTRDTEPSARALREGSSSQASQDKTAAENAPKLKLDGSGAGGAGSRAAKDEDFASMYNRIYDAQGAPVDPEADARKQLQASAEAMAGKELANAQTSKEGLAALLGGKESRIKGREDRAEKAENLNTKMAVINAGLAMMQSTGKGLAGIAEGATKGMGMYAEGLKLTAAERQKIEDAKDSFDDLRFNSENLSRKEITALENKITNAANITIEAGMGARDKERENKRATTKEIFTASAAEKRAEKDRAAQIQAAGVSALGATSGKLRMLEQLGAADPSSPLYKGYLMTVQEGQEPMLYKDYMTRKDDPMNGEAFRKLYPTFDLYKAGMSPSGGGNFVKPPAGAATPIYPR
jgi:hypothetical protein